MAKATEDAGFDSLWTGEHVVLPDPQVPPSPVAPEGRMLDPAVALTYAAAFTKTIRLGTGIIILPQRNPLVLAKELASVDVVSGGRLIFGVGVGYLQPEFDALGHLDGRTGATRRWSTSTPSRAIWSADKAAYSGKYVNFSGVVGQPQAGAVLRPGPVVMGGHTGPAWGARPSRTARVGMGTRSRTTAPWPRTSTACARRPSATSGRGMARRPRDHGHATGPARPGDAVDRFRRARRAPPGADAATGRDRSGHRRAHG